MLGYFTNAFSEPYLDSWYNMRNEDPGLLGCYVASIL
jgi:hypothetical protein